MRRKILIGTLCVAVVSAAAAVANGGVVPLLRGVSILQVKEVEIVGAWMLAPHEAYAMLDVRSGAHLFDDYSNAIGRIRAHPAVVDARVQRRLSGTLRLHVEEHLPVALLDDGDLVPVTKSGMPIPIDPTRAALDLPVVRRPEDASAFASLLDAVSIAGEGGVDVSEAAFEDGSISFRLVSGSRVRTDGMDTWRARQLASVLDDVGRGHGPVSADPSDIEIDLRYAGQVVVRSIEPTRGRAASAADTENRLIVSRRDTLEQNRSDA